MSYTLLPAQREFIHVEDDSVQLDVVCYQGGFGSGKSFIGALLGLELARKYQGSTGLVGALTLKQLEDTTLVSYYEHLDLLGLVEGVDYTYNKTKMRFIFHCWGDSRVLFRELNEPRKVKSLNIAWAHIEEASELHEDAFDMVLSRLRQSGISRYRLFLTTNPQPGKGWIHRVFVEKELKSFAGKNISYRRIIAPSNENTNLPDSFLESMKQKYDAEYYRINVMGQDGDYTAGLVCKDWSMANVDDSVEYEEDKTLYLTCDFNVDPMSWHCAHRYNGEYRFFDEVVIENTSIIETAQEFIARYGEHSKGIIVTGDASGSNRTDAGEKPQDTRYKILLRELSNWGVKNVSLDLRSANPYVHNRVESWNAMVCNSQGVRRVKVHPCCKQLIYNMENLKYVEGTSAIYKPTPHQIAKNPKLKFLGHSFDSASYLIERYDPVSKIQQRHKDTPRMSIARSGASRYA